MTTSDKILISLTVLGVAGMGYYLFSRGKRAIAGNSLLYPTSSRVITSPYGDRTNPITQLPEFHNGIDLQASLNDPIYSPADGTVISQYSNDLGGNQMLIKHTNGFTSGYAHLSAYLVTQGEEVKKGQEIAYAGASGEATASHLHFTLRDPAGTLVNPANYLS